MLTNDQPSTELATVEPNPPTPVTTRPMTPAERWDSQTMAQQVRVAEFLAQSDIVPDAFKRKPSNVWLALDMGGHMGLKPFQAFRSIHVIKGTPSFSAEAMRGLALAAGHTVNVTSSPTEATVEIIRSDGRASGKTTFTLEQAKRAGYLGKGGNWAADPESMLVARATSRCAKRVIPDLLMGLDVTEDLIDADAVPVAPVEVLEAATESAASAIEAATEEEAEADEDAQEAPQGPAPDEEITDAEVVEGEPETSQDGDQPLSEQDWRALAKQNGWKFGDISRAAKAVGIEGVSYHNLGKRSVVDQNRILEALTSAESEQAPTQLEPSEQDYDDGEEPF